MTSEQDTRQPVAQRYFAPANNSFWQWADEMEAIATEDGATIAFYQEVSAIVQGLSAFALPPFDAIVLFLAGCRKDATSAPIANTLARVSVLEPTGYSSERISAAFSRLGRCSKMLANIEQKVALATIVFENSNPPSPEDEVIRRQLRTRAVSGIPLTQSLPERLQRAMARFVSGVENLDEGSLDQRLRTGLDSEVQAPTQRPQTLPISQTRAFLDDLEEHEDELASIASIAKSLMAAIHIPRTVDTPEALPIGGYSDISNRGVPDRLLVSELAQDEDILAMRVNLNEALYLRRELPPQSPMRTRLILIDTGIRMWGIPRIFATALGLAFCATANPRRPSIVFRTSDSLKGSLAMQSDFTSRAGLTEHLEDLATTPHPGAALADLSAAEHAYGEDRDIDLIVITHPNAYTDSDFEKTTFESPLSQLYVATVNEDGQFQLWRHRVRGRKLIRSAQCELSDILLTGHKIAESLIDPDIDADLPLALRLRESPLLAAQNLQSEIFSYQSKIGLAAAVRDGRVLLWDRKYRGARTLYSAPAGATIEWLWLDDLARHLLIGLGPDLHGVIKLVRVSLENVAPKEITIDIQAVTTPKFSLLSPDNLLIRQDSTLYLVSTSTGAAIDSIDLGKTFWFRGRFVAVSNNEWLLPANHNSKLKLHRVFHEKLPQSRICCCFDREGQEGVHVVLENGSIFRLNPDPSLVHKMSNGTERVCEVSRDGSRIHYVDGQGYSRLLDLNSARSEVIPPRVRHPAHIVEKGLAQIQKRTPTLRKNFRLVCALFGKLALETKHGKTMIFSHSAEQGFIVLREVAASHADRTEVASFDRISSPHGEHHLLDRAEFSEGTRVYLDSRGLLHVVPGDNSLPQAAIILKDGPLSGWFSDGVWFGDQYFVGDHIPIDSASAFDRLTEYARNLSSALIP